jgi:hypothetical protein
VRPFSFYLLLNLALAVGPHLATHRQARPLEGLSPTFHPT